MVAEDEALAAFPPEDMVRRLPPHGRGRSEDELMALMKPLEAMYATLLQAIKVFTLSSFTHSVVSIKGNHSAMILFCLGLMPHPLFPSQDETERTVFIFADPKKAMVLFVERVFEERIQPAVRRSV